MASGKSAAGGAASGAAFGSAFGPWGTGIGAGLGGLIGLFGGGGDEKPMSPELERLMSQQVRQLEGQNPLVEAVYRLAFDRLPGAARAGLTGPSLQAAEQQTPVVDPGKSGYAQNQAVRDALRLQELRMNMSKPVMDAIQRMAASRMPRGYGSAPGGVFRGPAAPPTSTMPPPGPGETPGGDFPPDPNQRPEIPMALRAAFPTW